MFPSTIVIPAFLLLTFIYILFSFLHPSSKDARKCAPGPLALPVIGNLHLLGSLPHRSLQSLAQKYGPIMSLRLGQVPAIVVSSAEAAELFLKTHDPSFAGRPKIQATDYIFYGTKGMAFSEYGSYWRDMRKMSTLHLLSPSKLESFGVVRRKELLAMVKSIEKNAAMSEVVNLSEKVHGLLEDIVFKIIFGRNNDDQFDLKGLITQSLSLAGAFNLADYVPCLAPFDLQGLTRRLKETSKALDQVLEKIVKEHEEAGNAQNDAKQHHEDFIHILLSLMNHQPKEENHDEYEESHKITRDNIKAIALEIISASYDTSAVAIEWGFSELLRNPRVMRNLQNELQNVVGMNRIVEQNDLSKLNYLNMVVKETFRLHPVSPFLPRASTEDVIVNGYYIEKKSRVMVNVWAIGRDPKIWSDNADVFYPERFLDSEIDVQGHHFQLIPFGSGRRKCPGIQVGESTMKLVLAQLVHCFNWELDGIKDPSELDMTETFGFTTPRSKPLLVMPTHRLPSILYDD